MVAAHPYCSTYSNSSMLRGLDVVNPLIRDGAGVQRVGACIFLREMPCTTRSLLFHTTQYDHHTAQEQKCPPQAVYPHTCKTPDFQKQALCLGVFFFFRAKSQYILTPGQIILPFLPYGGTIDDSRCV